MAKITIKGIWQVLKDSFKGFSEDKVPKMSGSLAYYTVFSMGPLLIVIIYLAGLFLGQAAVEGNLYNQLEGLLGHDTALQLQDMVKNASVNEKGGTAATIGVIVLIIGATTVFGEIQDSINTIWGLKSSPKVGFVKLLITRLLSFGMIATLGFLLLVSLGVSAIIAGLGEQLQQLIPGISWILMYIINFAVTLTIISILFAIVFKVLPDANVSWKDVFPGAIATALLFLLGKFGISFYISKSDIGSTFGAAGSLVVLLVWVYYSSMLLYLGAEFTKYFAVHFGSSITPNKYAVWEKKTKVSSDNSSTIQEHVRNERKFNEDNNPSAKKVEVPKYKPVTTSKGEKKERKKNPGMGSLLAGLALYFINNSLKEAKQQRK
jgi:membrane protein